MTKPSPDSRDPDALMAERRRDLERQVASYGENPIDVSRPSPARRYNDLQGGKDNFQADRDSAAKLQKALPSIRLAAKELRRCMERQVAYLAERGVRQFLDIGCGLPQEPNVHEVAQAVDPSSRILYVDCDELVGSHSRALLIGTPEGTIQFLDGDLTDIGTVLSHETTRAVLDFNQPIAVLLLAVLHFIVDDQQAYAAVDQLRAALAPGSYVALTHVTYDPLDPGTAAHLAELAASMEHGPFKARTRPEVAAFLSGLELVEPGVVSTVEWLPERDPKPQAAPHQAVAYAGIGRLPSS
ncbi:SAM-dependent methyltransferase [Actinoplanes sp. NPDC048791]|uniref:SAM-dependent methyltransferase n=1 Tax=Actinoplanes sp. NPDC048791 TaxID=3154623 RepID=UPI0033FEB10B